MNRLLGCDCRMVFLRRADDLKVSPAVCQGPGQYFLTIMAADKEGVMHFPAHAGRDDGNKCVRVVLAVNMVDQRGDLLYIRDDLFLTGKGEVAKAAALIALHEPVVENHFHKAA